MNPYNRNKSIFFKKKDQPQAAAPGGDKIQEEKPAAEGQGMVIESQGKL